MGPTDAVPPVGAGNGGPDRRDVAPANPPPMTLGRAALIAVEGHDATGYGDGSRPVGGAEPFELLPGAREAALALLEGEAETCRRIDQLFELIAGFEAMYGMELMSTVHWMLAHRDPSIELTRSAVVDEVHRWSPPRGGP